MKLLKGLSDLGLKFTVGIRSNRRTTRGEKLCKLACQELRVELTGLEGLDVWMYWIWLPGATTPQQRFIITNDRRTAPSVRATGRRRWKIEALFKTLKSRFAFGKFGQKTKLGVLRYLCLSLAAFLLCHFE
ncbi:transposase [Deinococcus sp. SL84]|uniref:transposase n=1 Tax=Deinococcus sp. SL84 TaxID=2994663 RepID=UPI0022731C45|nr:transposase [Deinococcus sp. SL84]MCY1703742.1 transposase [Deinococcus sp. SL84]